MPFMFMFEGLEFKEDSFFESFLTYTMFSFLLPTFLSFFSACRMCLLSFYIPFIYKNMTTISKHSCFWSNWIHWNDFEHIFVCEVFRVWDQVQLILTCRTLHPALRLQMKIIQMVLSRGKVLDARACQRSAPSNLETPLNLKSSRHASPRAWI